MKYMSHFAFVIINIINCYSCKKHLWLAVEELDKFTISNNFISHMINFFYRNPSDRGGGG